MTIPKPSPIELTNEEQTLLERIDFDLSDHGRSRESVLAVCSAAADLTESLIRREAIPEIRRRYISDPALNIGSKRSRLQGFEQNGCKGREIIAHPNFLKYLRYFVFGPDLSERAIDGFRQILIEDAGTSGMVLDELCRFARAEARRLNRDNRRRAVEEFFKLALECGIDEGMARSIRDAVRSVR